MKTITPHSQTSKILLALTFKHKGNWNEIYIDIQNKVVPEDNEIEEIFNSFKGSFITILEEEYPSYLKNNCYKPPFVLFYEGNLNLLKEDKAKLAVASTRYIDRDRKQCAEEILNNCENICVLSGKSEMDTYLVESHNENKYIVVSSTPLSTINESFKRRVLDSKGLLLSEMPSSATNDITKDSIMNSYRIISGISDKLLVLSATQQSGINFIIANTLSQGKDVMVVPTSPMQKDYINNKFIGEGAIPVWSRESLQN